MSSSSHQEIKKKRPPPPDSTHPNRLLVRMGTPTGTLKGGMPKQSPVQAHFCPQKCVGPALSAIHDHVGPASFGHIFRLFACSAAGG